MVVWMWALAVCVAIWPSPGVGGPTSDGLPSSISGEPEAGISQEVTRQVARLLEELDSQEFSKRRAALETLEGLVRRAELRRGLALEFHRALVSPDLSFEVRTHLERLKKGLPNVAPQPPETVSDASLDQLVAQLDDDSYAVRIGAIRRLEWWLTNPRLACRIFLRIKRWIDSPGRLPQAPHFAASLYAKAREAWLTSDPLDWELPKVSRSEIDRLIGSLTASPGKKGGAGSPRGIQIADRELRDILARDECVADAQQALEARLADPQLGSQAAGKLQELLELTRPGMVAEYWQGGRQRGVQRLLIGVPSPVRPGAIRASYFDRIDDRVAHCVSGSNLSPGEYPVGIAIPHPNQPGAIFQLVNLSTPRRRMAYDYSIMADEMDRLLEVRDEAGRMRALSRRTIQWLLGQRRPLAEPELDMLGQLDPVEVSAFCETFFRLVDDAPLSRPVPPLPYESRPEATAMRPSVDQVRSLQEIDRLGGRPSRHGMFCMVLASRGTQRAVPGLLSAIEAGRFLPPSGEAPHRLPWIAVLAIAHRDPWAAVDSWLLGLLERTDPLVIKAERAASLGATAAGVLLVRHQQEPGDFGLQPATDALLAQAGLTGYRFDDSDARAGIVRWWNGRTEARP